MLIRLEATPLGGSKKIIIFLFNQVKDGLSNYKIVKVRKLA